MNNYTIQNDCLIPTIDKIIALIVDTINTFSAPAILPPSGIDHNFPVNGCKVIIYYHIQYNQQHVFTFFDIIILQSTNYLTLQFISTYLFYDRDRSFPIN